MPEKKLYRSTQDRMIAGVCGGIAEYFDIDSTLVRLIAIILVLANGVGLVLYIAAWLIMPENPAKPKKAKKAAKKQQVKRRKKLRHLHLLGRADHCTWGLRSLRLACSSCLTNSLLPFPGTLFGLVHSFSLASCCS